MKTAKLFMTGRSQAVRLPKEFRFKGKEVEIYRRGDEVVLRPGSADAERIFEALAGLQIEGWEADRQDVPPQTREEF